jgi:lipid-A-disaccharide synthase
MLEAARRFPAYRIIVCAAPGIADDFYTPYLNAHDTLTRDTYATVQSASAAIVNSGTATLETALLGCPQVAVYHLACSWLLGKLRWAQSLVFSIQYFTLVNIIEGKEVIKECVANDFTVDKITAELQRLLTDEAHKKEMLASYEHLQSLLGASAASETAARIITTRP